MTTGEKLSLNSSVSNTTALLHLLNPTQSGGDCLERIINGVKISIEKKVYSVKFNKIEYNATMETKKNKLVLDEDIKVSGSIASTSITRKC